MEREEEKNGGCGAGVVREREPRKGVESVEDEGEKNELVVVPSLGLDNRARSPRNRLSHGIHK